MQKKTVQYCDLLFQSKILQDERRSLLRKYGPRAIFDGAIGVAINLVSGGSIPASLAFSVASDIGLTYMVGLVLRPKWQAKTLRKGAEGYRLMESRIDKFLKIFEFQLPEGFVREPLPLPRS